MPSYIDSKYNQFLTRTPAYDSYADGLTLYNSASGASSGISEDMGDTRWFNGEISGGSMQIGQKDALATRVDEDGNFWIGAIEFSDAPFSITNAGALIATNATISGAISGSTIDIGGADATSFHVDINGNMWSGDAVYASGPFRVSSAGALVATNATISGAISGATIDIGGADATSFHVDINGNMWSGNASYASAPFKVSSAGALTATSANISGTITGSTITGSILQTGTSGANINIKSDSIEVRWDSVVYGGFYFEVPGGPGSQISVLYSDTAEISTITCDTLGVQTGAYINNGAILNIRSAGNDKNIQIYHNDTDGYITTNVGVLWFEPAGDSIRAANGTKIRAYSAGNDKYIEAYHSDVDGYISVVNGGVLFIDGAASVRPAGTTGTKSLGTSTSYWDDVSYKTLTDRGCLGWFDEGVEMMNGEIVSDTEALLRIQKHPTQKTIYGVDKLDYSTFPKVSYKPGKIAEKKYKKGDMIYGLQEGDEVARRDYEVGEVIGEEGIEMTSIFSVMIGAIKELTVRVIELESKK